MRWSHRQRPWSSRRALAGCWAGPAPDGRDGGGPRVPARAARARSNRCTCPASSSRSAGDGPEHAVGGAAQVPLLQPGVVVGGDAASWATSCRRSPGTRRPYPLVSGHEIVGVVAEVGPAVTRHRVGDRVGVGCMVNSCREWANCRNDTSSTASAA
ncbi:MAG TPA: alcohol dehydrogenase catalytic domain-containing protein [Blastococcus sp.]|nr:alcohol dehydrogenase catalytic domain-containing protein [Blastococcus sp.]